MNYTSTKNGNFKTPLSMNDLNPTMIHNSTANIQMTNNRKIDPEILNRIRELAPVEDIAPPSQPKNPFRAKTGLMFRDILGRADNNRSCSSCGNKK
jgi:hypothetical protein